MQDPCDSIKVPAILCMIEIVKQVRKFFSYPKRIRALEDADKKDAKTTATKFKTFCATSCVEKHRLLKEVHQLYKLTVVILQQVVTSVPGSGNLRFWLRPMGYGKCYPLATFWLLAKE